MRIVLTLIFISFLVNPVFAADPLKDLKILSAEKLDYKDGDSTLIGNVKIQLGEYIIEAPRVFVDSDQDSRPIKARFIEGVFLRSDSMQITAPIMEIDIEKSLFKCFSDDQVIVETKIHKKKGQIASEDDSILYSWYQEYNFETGFARALSGNEYAKEFANVDESLESTKKLEKVIFLADDLNIKSASVELELQENDIKYIDFIGKSVAVSDSIRTQAKELLYFPATNTLKAQGEVEMLYHQEQNKDKKAKDEYNQPTYIFSDLVLYERDDGIFSAFSNSLDANSQILSGESFGRSRQIIAKLDKNRNFDSAIFTGDAYTQHADKSVVGHEIVFDLKSKEMKTLVGRPSTQILSNN